MDEQRLSGTGTRILVIDDEEIVHASLRKILGRSGYDVETVFSAVEGLERIGRERYDLVITDLMMPEMNGLELLEKLRERGIMLPVILVTGYPTIRTAVQALRLGAMDYVAKPFTRKELLSPVRRALALDEEDTLPPIEGPEHREGEPGPDLLPGNVIFLPRHAWAEFQADGTFQVGIEDSFMKAIGRVSSIVLPDEMDMVEQGYPGIRITVESGHEHSVAMPLSGQVVTVNQSFRSDPASLDSRTWLIRLLPTQLDSEVRLLVRRS